MISTIRTTRETSPAAMNSSGVYDTSMLQRSRNPNLYGGNSIFKAARSKCAVSRRRPATTSQSESLPGPPRLLFSRSPHRCERASSRAVQSGYAQSRALLFELSSSHVPRREGENHRTGLEIREQELHQRPRKWRRSSLRRGETVCDWVSLRLPLPGRENLRSKFSPRLRDYVQ